MGGSPTGATLVYDAERRLNHAVSVTASPPTAEAWNLYDGEGNRLEHEVKQSGVATDSHYLAWG
jgi:hypothetical protein